MGAQYIHGEIGNPIYEFAQIGQQIDERCRNVLDNTKELTDLEKGYILTLCVYLK